MKTNDVFATGDSFTFFIVSGVDTVSNVSDSMLSLSARPGFEFQAGSNNQFIVRIKKHWVGGNKWFWAWKNFTSAPKHNPAIWELSFDSGDKKRGSVYHNGNSLGTVDYQENHIPNQTINRLKLFTTRTTPHYGVDGFLAELLFFSYLPDDDEKSGIESYLAHKWGLVSNLRSDHPSRMFSIDANGSLSANKVFDYEVDDRNYTITVRAIDDHNASFDKNFTVTVANIVEDLDSDGTEDYYDDDIDGDGLSNVDELAFNSDPWDASSTNRPPNGINASNLTIAENSAIGSEIGQFNAIDPNGEGNFTFSLLPPLPDDLNFSLWLDASSLSRDSTIWFDKSGNNRDANVSGSVKLEVGKHKGKSLMRYDGSGFHHWLDINDSRTIFWVVRAESNNDGFLIGDNDKFHFHNSLSSPLKFWHPTHTFAAVRDGNLSINGSRNVDGVNTSMNSSLSDLTIVTLQTSGDVEASRFSADRTFLSRKWKGDLAELLISSEELTEDQINKMEGYLAHKWGLLDGLPSTHPYKVPLYEIDENGSLTVNQTFDYETDDRNYTNRPSIRWITMPPSGALPLL